MRGTAGKQVITRRKRGAAARAKRPGKGLRAFVGLFASGTGDLAPRHDDYLYGWKKPRA